MKQYAADFDWVLMNGDKSSGLTNISHLNLDPTGTVADKVLAMNGLRHMSIITNTADAVAHATIAKTTMGIMRALQGSRGVIGDDLANEVVFGAPESQRKFQALTEWESMADVGADKSTLLNGQTGSFNGVPLLSTQAIELADANGKYDAVTAGNNTTGQLVAVNKSVVMVAMFQEPAMFIDTINHARSFQISMTAEADIQQMEVGGTADLYNNTV